MFNRLILPAAVLLFASACHSESAGPQWIDLPANVNLGLPSFRQLSNETPRSLSDAPVPTSPGMLASLQVDGEELPPEFEQVMARGRLISDPSEAEAGFIADASVAYGQALGTSIGSYYRNDVQLKISMNGQQVSERSESELESCNCTHLWNPWGRTANATIAVSGACGLTASAYARHTARLDFTTWKGTVFTLLADSDNGSDHNSQPSCPFGVRGGSGGGGGLEGEAWYICYWEDYYDLLGNFIQRVELGCVPLYMS